MRNRALIDGLTTDIEEKTRTEGVPAKTVVFLSCPLVKKHADLFGSFLYQQSTMKDMYSKPTNRTELSIPMTKSLAYPLSIPKMVEERKTTRMSLNS